MALRKYNAVKGGDSANHTSDGFIIPRTRPVYPTDEPDVNCECDITVDVGTTTTLEPEADATVTRTGTPEEIILNFGIPEGKKGEKGNKGEDLLASQLNFTINAETGSTSAAYISGSYPNFHIALVLERGPKGDEGDPATCNCTCDCCNGGGGDDPTEPPCPEGFEPDGNGNCIPIDVDPPTPEEPPP